jgi:hypothetical protein
MNRNLICHTNGHKTFATENHILSKISLSHLKSTHSLSLPLTPLSLSPVSSYLPCPRLSLSLCRVSPLSK